MKINRFVALAAIALLVVGAMGAVNMKVFAQGSHNPVTSVSAQSDPCAQDQADGTEIASAADTDNIDLQCGDQNAPDASVNSAAQSAPAASVSSAAPDGQETVRAADTDNVQVEEQVGSQSGSDTGVEAPEVETPATP